MSFQSLINKVTKFQTCVYWAPLFPDAHGQQRWDAPVELPCRWTDDDVEYVGPHERKFTDQAKVMLRQDVAEGGILWLGKLSDWGQDSPPTVNEGGLEIQKFRKVPDFTASVFYREAILSTKPRGN